MAFGKCYICNKTFKTDRGTVARLYPDNKFRKIHIKCGENNEKTKSAISTKVLYTSQLK